MPIQIPAIYIPDNPGGIPIQLDVPPLNVINPNPPNVIGPNFTPPNQGMGIIRIGPHSLNHGSIYELVEITLTRKLGEFPTCSITYYSLESNTPAIGSNLSILGIPFLVESVDVTQYLQTNPMAYVINISLISIHAPRGGITPEHELDRPIRFDKDTTSINWGSISAKLTQPVVIPDTQYKRYFDGQSEILITPRQELDSAFLTSSKFIPFYSAAQIGAVNPQVGNGTIVLDNRYVLNESVAIANKNTPFYLDTEINLETPFDEDEDEEDKNNSLKTITRYEFENCFDALDLQTPRVPGASPEQMNEIMAEEMKDPSNAFDNGGRTKRMRKIKEKDGNPIKIEETVYGYMFNSVHAIFGPTNIKKLVQNNYEFPIEYMYSLPDLATSAWVLVEKSIETFDYDGDGYLISSNKKTTTATRLKKEGSGLEAFKANLRTFYVLPPPPNDQDQIPAYNKMVNDTIKEAFKQYKIMQSYLFYTGGGGLNAGQTPFSLPWNGGISASTYTHTSTVSIEYFLEKLTNYYNDIEVAKGEPKPKYARTIRKHSHTYTEVPNPLNDPDGPGSPFEPYITQQVYTEYTKTEIIIPSSANSKKRQPELFVTTSYTQHIEGDGTTNSLRMGNSIQQAGRPSVHTRIGESANGGGGGGGGKIVPGFVLAPIPDEIINIGVGGTPNKNDEPPEEKRYFINPSPTAKAATNPMALSSVSWGGIASVSAAKTAADNHLLRETLSSTTMQLNLIAEYYPQLKEGNIIIIDTLRWLVLEVQANYKAVAPYKFTAGEGLQLTLGLLPSNLPTNTVESVT